MFNEDVSARNELASMISGFGFADDSSIEGDYPLELISPPMSGKAGEEIIIEVLEASKSLGYEVDDSCGVHIHLDGEGFKEKPHRVFKFKELGKGEKIKHEEDFFIVSRKLIDRVLDISSEDLFNLLEDGKIENLVVGNGGRVIRETTLLSLDGESFFAKHYLLEEVKKGCPDENKFRQNDVVVICSKKSIFKATRNALAFYTAFNDIFLAMMPNDRREKNRFCQKLTNDFSVGDLFRLTDSKDLERYWYKTRTLRETENRKRGHYDDSRYRAINFHSLFSERGTIEIRLHAGTLDAKKILYWVALHQHILDCVVARTIEEDSIKEAADLYSLKDKKEFFFDVLSLPPMLKRYVNTIIKFISEEK